MPPPIRSRKYLPTLLALLLACRAQLPPAATAPPVAPPAPAPSWAATIADRLYQHQVLNAAGRDTLRQRIAAHALGVQYEVPGREAYPADTLTDPATVLHFCSALFQREVYYRLDAGHGAFLVAGPPTATDSVSRQLRQSLQAALRQTRGDTAAALRALATPPQLIESRIPAEDSLVQTSWTIYPPLSGAAAAGWHGIADGRSVYGRTRTRLARDFYELGLLSEPQYAVLRRELAARQLPNEPAVCERAAQLALEVASYPTRRLYFDSLLTRLGQVGVLPAAGRQRALADSQVLRQLRPFDLLPYCAHAEVLALATLPRDPARLYPRLLADVAALWPAFRYTGLQVQPHERDTGGDLVEELVRLGFTAGGRRYTTTFNQNYRRKDGRDPDPNSNAEVAENFEAGINQWLRDQGTAERLYQAHTPDERSVYGRQQLGLIVLTPMQRAAWGQETYFLSPENTDTLFTSGYIERALALYQRLGLLAGLTAAERAAGHLQALSGGVGSYAELLGCFPGRLVEMGGEDAEEPQAYGKALARVAAATRSRFRPVRVRDSFEGEQGRRQHSALSFTCGQRHYRTALTSDLGWMDTSFVPLVQRAVRESTGGQLYYLGWGDETGEYLFLTASQAATLRRVQPALFRAADEDEDSHAD